MRRQVEGRRLTQLDSTEIDESLLDGIWRQVAILSTARIAHHDLRPKNFLIDTAGDVWLLNFTFGRVSAAPRRCAQDIAEALVSLTALVGVQRTVRSARRTLSPDQLETSLAYLQPLALPRRIRTQVDGRYVLTDLRETLADAIDRPSPTFHSPLRPSTIIGLLLFGAAVYVLLPQLSGLHEVVGPLRGPGAVPPGGEPRVTASASSREMQNTMKSSAYLINAGRWRASAASASADCGPVSGPHSSMP
ncbi:hypothetical protein [Amycolatopsis sp. NPDC051372]|uniref:hypothetical protein n=1 Tax=Amycolatopsis sp. NPDC051372 TaxID=3155669 RepID=UPI00342F897A